MKFIGVLVPGLLAAAILAGAPSAHAGVVFSDNFDPILRRSTGPATACSNRSRSRATLRVFPSIDLVSASDGFPELVFLGNSVDLDGTTGSGDFPAGELQSITSLSTGSYTVQFEFAGNERGASPETTVISIGNQSFSLTPPNSQGYTLTTLFFTNVSGKLSFTDLGPRISRAT